jgi:5'-deoxynucleotidase YfbR-like HD superfamily hydrolase
MNSKVSEQEEDKLAKHVVERDVQNVLEALNQASNVTRYSRDYMHKKESVLEHTGFCAVFSLWVAKRMREKGHLISMSVVLEKAIEHDLEEILTGDVARPTKYCSPEVTKGFKEYEAKMLAQLEQVLKVKFERWATAKDSSIEGRICKLADFAAVAYKVMVECAMFGNKAFLRVQEEAADEINKAILDLDKNDPLTWVWLELQSILRRSKTNEITFGKFFRGA